MRRRLIIAPQLPVRMRYQEWWYTELPNQYLKWFDVILLGGGIQPVDVDSASFSVAEQATRYEASLIAQYMSLKLRSDDVLLLCDLSYPGLFSHVLWHKKPSKAFAICHASARNRYDIFAPVRRGKFAVETKTAQLFDTVFVASHYHAQKLKWPNTMVVRLPYPPFNANYSQRSIIEEPVVTVARKGKQKRTTRLEKIARRAVGYRDIYLEPNIDSWTKYYWALSRYKFLLSTAKEETFGYQIVDAVLCGTAPIAPNKYAYPELLPRGYLYDTPEELIRILQSYPPPIPKLLCHDDMLRFYENTARRMLQ